MVMESHLLVSLISKPGGNLFFFLLFGVCICARFFFILYTVHLPFQMRFRHTAHIITQSAECNRCKVRTSDLLKLSALELVPVLKYITLVKITREATFVVTYRMVI